MRGYRPSLTFSILASLACLLVLTWVLFSLFALTTAERDLFAQKADHARMLLATFVNQLPEQLPTFPEGMLPLDASAAIYAGKLAEEQSFERLTLLDGNGKVIYTVGRDGSDQFQPFMAPAERSDAGVILAGGASLARTAPVLRDGQSVGRAGLVLSLAGEQLRLQRSRQLFMAYFALDFILLLGFGSAILSRIVVRPVNRLLTATERITGGVYGHQVAVAGPLELARLAESFNGMSSVLLQKQNEVGSYVKTLEQVNRNLEQAREEAVRSEKMASVGLLAAGTAHEIGTPLASVMGYAELLSAEVADNQVQTEYLQRIQQGCSRIDRIVRGLLDYARPKSPAFELVALGPLVIATVELLQHQGLFKQCRVEVRCPGQVPLVNLDPHQLQQVLINLLINSHDAMPDKGQLLVEVCADDPQKTHLPVRIRVQDTGSGIAEKDLGRIFDPFFTTKDPGRGTGLGLAISTRIIEGFGGRITVESSLGKGSCFTVHLPTTDEAGLSR